MLTDLKKNNTEISQALSNSSSRIDVKNKRDNLMFTIRRGINFILREHSKS